MAEIYKGPSLGNTGEEQKRICFPPLEKFEGLKYEDLPTIDKIEFGVGTHIRCLKFHCSDGTESEKTGTFSLDRSIDMKGQDVGKIET
jgi:hypothetical protein